MNKIGNLWSHYSLMIPFNLIQNLFQIILRLVPGVGEDYHHLIQKKIITKIMIRTIYICLTGLLVSNNSFNCQGQWTESKLPIPSNVVMYDINFESETKGWAVGTDGYILTFDGNSWEIFTVIAGNHFNRVVFPRENDGWAITGSGKIFHYNGTEWSLYFTATGNKGLFTLHFVSPTEGFVSGADGYLAYYDGANWTEGNIGFNVWTLTSYFKDNKNGWLSGSAGDLYQFKDSVWSEVSIASSGAFSEMTFLTPDNGYGAGWENNIWHYNGTNWTASFTSSYNLFTDIFFLDKDHGWAGGEGYIATYLNGVWSEENVASDWIHDIYFTDPGHGWAMGENAMLLTYEEQPPLVLNADLENTTKQVIYAYPNPTNGMVALQLTKEYQKGNIQVFNANGILIFTGVITKTKSLDFQQFPSGPYLVKIRTDNEVYDLKIIRE